MSSPIFISHSSRDRDWAYRLINDLEKRGVPCWISSRDIEPGADYQKSIVDALEAAPAMVLLAITPITPKKFRVRWPLPAAKANR